MPKPNDHPEFLRPYIQHRVDLTYSGTSDAVGVCPFCDSQKFYVSQKNGLYSCKVCPKEYGSGNIYTFIRKLHEISSAPRSELEVVAEERKVSVESLIEEGLVKSAIDNEWLLPAYSIPKDGKSSIINLYR